MVLENLSQKKNIIMQFFEHYLDSDRADIMERLYYENIELLEKLYLYAMKKTFDYEGDLLIRLVKRNTSFWNEVTHALSGNITRGLYIHNIFDKIWDMDNYDELISIAYDNLIGSKYRIYMQEESVFIFSNGQKVSEEVKKHFSFHQLNG